MLANSNGPVNAPYTAMSAAVQRHAALQPLRRMIATGQLAAGQALIETELAQRLAVSRPTVREALRELETEGLATRSRARGLAVRRLARSDVRELYDIREALEALAAAGAARRLSQGTPAGREPFEQQLALWQTVAASGQIMAFSEANRELHALILGTCGNSHLPRLMDQTLIDLFSAQLRGWIAPPLAVQAAREHVRLLHALLAGDSAAAEREMRTHVRASAATVLALPDEAF
jgi:DNA-binding GntR family transcriptional regulator